MDLGRIRVLQDPTRHRREGRPPLLGRCHVFTCAKAGCRKTVTRYLDSKDATSTSNMIKHIRGKCFGDAAWEAAKDLSAKGARANVVSPLMTTGKITAVFERQNGKKGAVTFSTIPHTRAEIKAETVKWCAESNRPFSVVEDRGYRCLTKTGRPHYYVPSATTVSRDTKRIFARCRTRIAKLLQDYDGELSFIVDCWTSPNHKAMFGICVELMLDGAPLTLVLDVIEVAKSPAALQPGELPVMMQSST
ncbi:hypothetical protein GGX14DRAFT_359148 [Mycena pura]|uniref:Transposase n=1 Tax=Mycena pura TaxID=153505 RepID=A0AAD6YGE4_9AGAR|nr:hypothetical protein GGX14DRAFT_359148 [Mycena pura]